MLAGISCNSQREIDADFKGICIPFKIDIS